jgi:Kef-type K+ transport system membrane component KefB
VVFLGVAVAAGPYIVRAFDRLADWLRSEVVLVVFAFSYLLLMAHLAEKIGMAGIIGSYAAGLVFSKRDEAPLERAFEPLTEILTPIFFVLIGSSIAFGSEMGVRSIGAIGLILMIALVGKFFAPWLVPRFRLRRGMVGSGLVPRGEVGLVFAQVGLTSLVLTQSQYSILTLVLVATTLAGPVLFRRFTDRTKPEEPKAPLVWPG